MSTTDAVGVRQVAEVSSDYTADPADYLILVDTSGGPVTITLPSSGRGMPFGKRVVDAGGQSETNSITVESEGSEAIRRGGSEVGPVTLGQNDGSWDFHPQSADGDWAYSPAVQDHSQLQGVSEGDHRSQEQVEDIVGALISAAGSNISVTYDDGGDSLTIGLSDSVDVTSITADGVDVTGVTFVRANRTSDTNGVSAGTWTNWPNNELDDNLGELNASQQFVPDSDGWYVFGGGVSIAPSTDGDVIAIRLRDVDSGADVGKRLGQLSSLDGSNILPFYGKRELTAGTAYELQVVDFQNSYNIGQRGEIEIAKALVHP